MSEDAPAWRWELGASRLEIAEQSTALATDDLVGSVSADRWRELGISFRRSPGDTDWTARASDLAGIVRLDVSGRAVHLRVAPKVEGLDLFFLADWAYGTQSAGKKLKNARANLAALRSEPAACLIGWYVAEMLTFATRWLRRGYVMRDEDLVGRVRGRIDFARYLSHSVARARPDVIPARFAEPSRDTPVNRYLKAGLRQAAILSRSLPLEEARVALEELILRALSLFADVRDVSVQPQDALRLNLSGPLRHYQPMVAFTKAVLEGTYVSTELGSHAQDAIMWSLNRLYEKALSGLLDSWPGATRVHGTYSATITGLDDDHKGLGSSPVKPDFVMSRADGSRLVLDAKYKDTLTKPSPGDAAIDIDLARGRHIRVRRTDVYQAVAYASHSELRADKAALLYPVALGSGEDYPPPLTVREFQPACHVVFVDVGPHGNEHRADLYATLDRV